MPYILQEKYSAEPIQVLIASGEMLRIDVRNLTPDQACQVFSDSHIRSQGEQRAWIEDRNAKQAVQPIKANLPYRIVGKKLMVMTPCQFTTKELAQLLAEIEA